MPIVCQYTLTTDDIYGALKTSKVYRKNFVKAIIESALLAAMAILFGVWWILWEDSNAMVFCIACAVLIAAVWAMVTLSIRRNCHKFVTGQPVQLTIHPDRIAVSGGAEIPLDGSVPCKERNKVLILETGESEWTLIPLRQLENADEVRARVLQGTRSFG